MEYIALNDIQDAILQVTDSDVLEANRFIEETAARFGVTAEKICVPVTFTVRRLGVIFACYNRCLLSVGSDGSVIFDGKENSDIFAQKLQFYRAELKKITDGLLESDFTGTKNSGGVSIKLWRS